MQRREDSNQEVSGSRKPKVVSTSILEHEMKDYLVSLVGSIMKDNITQDIFIQRHQDRICVITKTTATNNVVSVTTTFLETSTDIEKNSSKESDRNEWTDWNQLAEAIGR